MPHERSGSGPASPAAIERLADALFDLAGDQEVRVIEALASVLARQRRDMVDSAPPGLCEASAAPLFASRGSDAASAIRRAICQRIARRALHGSLVDPTRGATAVHRVDDSPAWSRDLLPIGMFGPFLFYRPPLRCQGDSTAPAAAAGSRSPVSTAGPSLPQPSMRMDRSASAAMAAFHRALPSV